MDLNNYECEGQTSIEDFIDNKTENRFREIFHEIPIVVRPSKEFEKYLHEIASELKKIRQTLERRR